MILRERRQHRRGQATLIVLSAAFATVSWARAGSSSRGPRSFRCVKKRAETSTGHSQPMSWKIRSSRDLRRGAYEPCSTVPCCRVASHFAAGGIAGHHPARMARWPQALVSARTMERFRCSLPSAISKDSSTAFGARSPENPLMASSRTLRGMIPNSASTHVHPRSSTHTWRVTHSSPFA